MEELSKLPNIGKTLEKQLMEVGINSPAELLDIGSKEAFTRIRIIDLTACFNMLCALEGAVQGIRWHYLSEEVKADLRGFYDSFKL